MPIQFHAYFKNPETKLAARSRGFLFIVTEAAYNAY